MKSFIFFSSFFIGIIAFVLTTFSSCTISNQKHSTANSTVDSLKNLSNASGNNKMVKKNLATYDKLENIIFINRDWTRLNEGYSKDIIVNYPNRYKTSGIEKHIEDLKKIFAFAPDTKIKQHIIHFGSGNMTCVTGIMTGTFSAPMSIGNGKLISPTGKQFSLPVCAIGIWKDGVMVTEYLYWDNEAYLNQIGLIE